MNRDQALIALGQGKAVAFNIGSGIYWKMDGNNLISVTYGGKHPSNTLPDYAKWHIYCSDYRHFGTSLAEKVRRDPTDIGAGVRVEDSKHYRDPKEDPNTLEGIMLGFERRLARLEYLHGDYPKSVTWDNHKIAHGRYDE